MRKINVNEKSLDDKKGDVLMFLEKSKTCMIVSLSFIMLIVQDTTLIFLCDRLLLVGDGVEGACFF